MSIKDVFSKIATGCFYCGLIVESIILILEKSSHILQYEGLWFRIAFVFFTIKVILTKYSWKDFILASLGGLLGIISYLVTGNNDMLRVAMFVIACKDIRIDKAIKTEIIVLGSGMLLLLILSFIGVGTLKLTQDFRGYVETRYCFGMGHPNTFHGMLWILSSLIMYYTEKSKQFPFGIGILVINIVVYFFTKSRTGFLLIFLLIVMVFVYSKFEKLALNKVLLSFESFCIMLIIPIVAGEMDWDCYEKVFGKVDRLITHRILCTYDAGELCRIENWLPFSARGRNPLSDVGMAKMIGWYGYVPAILFVLLEIVVLYQMRKEKDISGICLVLVLSVCLLFEAHPVARFLSANYFWLILGKYWVKFKPENENYLWSLLLELIKGKKCVEKNVK